MVKPMSNISNGDAIVIANMLISIGYRRTSNKYRIISRIDREDWKEHLAEKHAPWDIEEGMSWVERIGEGANDFYRRCCSKDKIEYIDVNVFKLIPTSNFDSIGYVDYKEK